VRKRPYQPTVSLVIALHNEARNVVAKMKNCAELDYPGDKLQVVVSLDAPTDSTLALLQNCAPHGAEILFASVRAGKAVALNRGVAAARGEILVFGDAAQQLERQAIRELVANFSDETVGAVSGALILLDENNREARDGA